MLYTANFSGMGFPRAFKSYRHKKHKRKGLPMMGPLGLEPKIGNNLQNFECKLSNESLKLFGSTKFFRKNKNSADRVCDVTALSGFLAS